MAISKKDAKTIVGVMKSNLTLAQLNRLLGDLKVAGIKNKSFRKSIKRLAKMLERKVNKPAMKKAA